MLVRLFLIFSFSYISLFGFEHLTKVNIDEKLKDKKVIVDFYATWCPPCKIISKNLEKFGAKKPNDVYIYKVDVDKARDMAIDYGVRTLPTIMYFKNGKMVAKEVGIKSVDDLMTDTKEYLN